MLYIIPAIAITLGLTGGWTTAFERKWLMFSGLVVVLIAMGGLLFLAGQQAQGWDGIGYAIWLALGVMPCLLGVLIGGIIGILRRRAQDKKAEADLIQ